MIKQKFLQDLPDEPVRAMLIISERVLDFDAEKTNQQRLDAYEDYLNVMAAVENYSHANNLCLDFPDMSTQALTNINRVVEFFETMKNRIERNLQSMNDGKIPKEDGPAFESYFFKGVTRDDRNRTQNLLN